MTRSRSEAKKQSAMGGGGRTARVLAGLSCFAWSVPIVLPLALQDASTWQIPDKYAERSEGRSRLENKKVSAAIANGLEWLRLHQDKDGHWDSDEFMKHDKIGIACTGPGKMQHDSGLTGLALLCFLADGNSTLRGLYKSQVRRAVKWLREHQDARGRIGYRSSHDFIYEHAIAALALVEAYALSGDPAIRSVARAAVRYLEGHRNPGAAWQYQPRDRQNDSSVTAWALLACIAGRDVGFELPAELFGEVDAWFLSVTDKKTGRTGYQVAGGLPARTVVASESFPATFSESTTAISLFCRVSLGHRVQSEPLLLKQARLLDAKQPRWNEDAGSIDMYYWYYGSLAQRQMPEPYASRWYATLSKALLPAQRSDANSKGSFDPVGAWGKDGGRIYSTCMCVLSLQSPYRYAVVAELTPFPKDPVYRRVRKYWQEERYDRVHAFLEEQRTEPSGAFNDKRLVKAEKALGKRSKEATSFIAGIGPRTRFHAAKRRLEEIKKNFGSLEPGKLAREKLGFFRRNKAIARELRAGDELERLRKKVASARSRLLPRLKSSVEKLLAKYKTSQVADEIKALLESVDEALRRK